jgi:hypothetical protein
MSFDGRITRLEKGCQVGQRAPATFALVVLDAADYRPRGELPEHVRALIPPSVNVIFSLADNGRDPHHPSVSFGGPGWCETVRLRGPHEAQP